MGYRSSGAIWFSEKSYKTLSQELKDELNKDWEPSNEHNLMWFFEDWKWYESYEDIKKWNKWMSSQEEDDDYMYGYDFIRIGEENDDTEINTGEMFCLCRTIDICG